MFNGRMPLVWAELGGWMGRPSVESCSPLSLEKRSVILPTSVSLDEKIQVIRIWIL